MPVLLQYARATPSVRRWARNALLLLWAIVTAYLIYDKWGLWARLQWRLWEAQRACRTYSEPAERVVLEPDPEKAPVLAVRGDYREARTSSIPTFEEGENEWAASLSTAAEKRYDAQTLALTDLQWWDHRDEPPSSAPMGGGGGLFGWSGGKGAGPNDKFVLAVHELRRPAKPPRLVVIEAFVFGEDTIAFTADVRSVAGLFGRPKELNISDDPYSGDNGLFTLSSSDGGGVRLFAPQFDPNDRARFTFAYEADGGRGTVEGRLGQDDTITFTVLDGPCFGLVNRANSDEHGAALESDHEPD